MKTKRTRPLSPRRAILNEIATLNRAEAKIVADAAVAATRAGRKLDSEYARLKVQIDRLIDGHTRSEKAMETAVERQLRTIETRRSRLQARLAALA